MSSTINRNDTYTILGSTLQDICNAVKDKTGDSSMPVIDLATKISSIPVFDFTCAPKDVIFIDYDGTVIEEYSKEEYLQKEASSSQGYNTYYVPTPPAHDGLTFDGWNFPSDTEIGNYINTIGCAVIGALYKTTDDKLKIYLNIEDSDELALTLSYYKMSSARTFTINWGDGTSATIDSGSSGYKTQAHTYAQTGEYLIQVQTDNTSIVNQFRLGGSNTKLLRKTSTTNSTYLYSDILNCVRKVECPGWIDGILGYCFYGMPNLKSVSVPAKMGSTASVFPSTSTSYAFRGCTSLTGFVIPYPNGNATATQLGTQTFLGCVSLQYVSIPYAATLSLANPFMLSGVLCIYACGGATTSTNISLINMQNHLLRVAWGMTTNPTITLGSSYYCSSLKSVDFSSFTSTTIPSSWMVFSVALKTLKLPKGITTIKSSAFSGCWSLTELDFSSGDVTGIEANAFNSCYNCLIYDFTGCTTVPTLASTSALSGINSNAKIVVPDSLVTSWKAASNWSTYASYIIGESDYNA